MSWPSCWALEGPLRGEGVFLLAQVWLLPLWPVLPQLFGPSHLDKNR